MITYALFAIFTFSIDIWSKLQKWILDKTSNKINFTSENILFGFTGSNNKDLNCILLVAKQTLYNTKLQNKVPYLPPWSSAIMNYKNEKIYSRSKMYFRKFP